MKSYLTADLLSRFPLRNSDRLTVPATLSPEASAAIGAILAKQPHPFDDDDYADALKLLKATRPATSYVAVRELRGKLRTDGLVAGQPETVELMRLAADMGADIWRLDDLTSADVEQIDDEEMLMRCIEEEEFCLHPLAFSGQDS